MRTRFFASAVIFVLVLSSIGFAVSDTRSVKAKKRETARLVALLPASDAVAVIDTKKVIDDSLPKVFVANQPVLGEIMASLDDIKSRTGIDLSKFEQVAVGVAMKQVSEKSVDFDPVAVASGDINAGAMVAVARLASNGGYREEKIGSRTVYVYSAKGAVQKTPIKISSSKIANAIDQGFKALTGDVAVSALDRNTLVMGSLPRVRETLEAASHLAPDISSMLPVRETAVIRFAMKPPGGLSKWLPMDADAFGENLDSIQYLSGTLDINATGSSLQVLARTKEAKQAAQLKDTLDVLQSLGGPIFSNSKRADQKVYGRMVKSAKFELRGTDVTLDLTVPQADIDILIGGIK